MLVWGQAMEILLGTKSHSQKEVEVTGWRDTMYLHLGQSVVVPYRSILGIFDLDHTSWAYKTREFLECAQREGRVISVCDDLPRSFVLVGEKEDTAMVYICQLSPTALLRRVENHTFE